jgi:hypothetical protein
MNTDNKKTGFCFICVDPRSFVAQRLWAASARNAAISIIYGTTSLHLENVQGKLEV